MKDFTRVIMTLLMLCAAGTSSAGEKGTIETYDFVALFNGGYTTINSSGTKNFEGKSLKVISSFANAEGEVGANVGGRIAALYQKGNGTNFWMRDASRPWFVSAGKTSYMAFDNLKAGDVVKIVGYLHPLTILCNNVEGYENGKAFDATYTEEAPLELVAKTDGYIYGSYGPLTAITKITVETSAVETTNDPIISVTGAMYEKRIVTIDANTGSAGTEQTVYYTLDGSDPTKDSEKYTDPFSVFQSTMVKAIAYCGESASNVVTLEVEAGATIKLNDPELSINSMLAKGSLFSPVYTVSVDNSQLIGAPIASLQAMFLGEDVTADLVAGTFIPKTNGELIVTSTAEGYESSMVTEKVYSSYAQVYASADYSTLTDEASVLNVLGNDWAKMGSTRWANWNKYNATYGEKYVIYGYTGEDEGSTYLDNDNKVRGSKGILFMESFGFGRGISGTTRVFIDGINKSEDITLYRVINSKGLDVNTYTETFVKTTYNDGMLSSEFNIPGCETLCQVIIYSPVLSTTYTVKFINTEDWEKIYVWIWNDEGSLYEYWPGEEIMKTGEQVDGHDVYVWAYTGDFVPTYIIFGNGNIGQTNDLEFVNNGIYNLDGFVRIDEEADPEVYTEFVAETGTLTYYYDNKREKRTGVTELYDPVGNPDAVRFTGYYNKIQKAVIDPSMKDAPLTSTVGMFYGGMNTESFRIQTLYKMTAIEGLENLNTALVTDMNSMFFSCSGLTMLDLSSFNTANVTNMNGMFLGCNNLQMVDVSSFDISSVTDLRMMFSGCSKLTTICCFSDWGSSSAQSDNMFMGCSSLVGGQGTTFDSSNVDKTYARPDGGAEAPGYFMADTMTGISLTTSPSRVSEGSIYNLKGQRLSKPAKGINILGGKKILR